MVTMKVTMKFCYDCQNQEVFLRHIYIFLIFKAISGDSVSPPNLEDRQTYNP